MKIDLRGLRSSPDHPKACIIPEDYVELIPRYIHIFRGAWLKYTEKNSGMSFPGGFLIDYGNGLAVLRNIKQQVTEVVVKNCIFYCKNDLEIYKAVKELLIERDRLEADRALLNAERNKLMDEKKQFYARSAKISSTV